MGLYQEAIDTCDIILNLYPPGHVKTWKCLSLKGMALNNLGKHKQAIAVVNRAIELNPKDDGIWETKGAALAAQGKYREALMCFEEALRLNPDNESAKVAKEQVMDYVQDFWG
jgi:tetratricopeptide (TPR) repeat protein